MQTLPLWIFMLSLVAVPSLLFALRSRLEREVTEQQVEEIRGERPLEKSGCLKVGFFGLVVLLWIIFASMRPGP